MNTRVSLAIIAMTGMLSACSGIEIPNQIGPITLSVDSDQAGWIRVKPPRQVATAPRIPAYKPPVPVRVSQPGSVQPVQQKKVSTDRRRSVSDTEIIKQKVEVDLINPVY